MTLQLYADIEIYDLEGNLIANKERATDLLGRFIVNINDDNITDNYILKSKNGYIKNIPFKTTLINVCVSGQECYLTPYTTLVQYLKDSLVAQRQKRLQKQKRQSSKYFRGY